MSQSVDRHQRTLLSCAACSRFGRALAPLGALAVVALAAALAGVATRRRQAHSRVLWEAQSPYQYGGPPVPGCRGRLRSTRDRPAVARGSPARPPADTGIVRLKSALIPKPARVRLCLATGRDILAHMNISSQCWKSDARRTDPTVPSRHAASWAWVDPDATHVTARGPRLPPKRSERVTTS